MDGWLGRLEASLGEAYGASARKALLAGRRLPVFLLPDNQTKQMMKIATGLV